MSQYDEDSSNFLSSEPPLNIDVDTIPDAVLVANSDSGRIVKANTAAGELFGCHPTGLIGRHQQDLHPSDEDYVEAFERAIDSQRVNRLQNGQPLYIETFDGHHIPIEINVQRLDTPADEFVLGVFREVTDQVNRERRLKETTSRLETLLDALPLPVAVIDTEGTVERWNRASETTFGYAADSIIGKPYPLFIEDDEFDRLFERVRNGGILDGYETTYRAQDGSRVPVELYSRPLYEDGTFTGVIGAAIDLSDRQQKEQQLEVLHRVLRHNLRTELTVIDGWNQQLADGNADRQTAIEKIETASDRLFTLGEEAKRIRTGLTGDVQQFGSIPITKVISQLSEQVSEQSSVTMRVSEEPESSSICRRGQQAVSQLLDRVLTCVDEGTLDLAIVTHDQHVVLELTAPVAVLPAGARSFINTGKETALHHSSDLEVPKAYLMIQSIGGDVTVTVDADAVPANTLSIELPRMGAGDNSS